MQVVSGYDNPAKNIFPNFVTHNYFIVNLNKNLPGKYRISISNLIGDQLSKTIVNFPLVYATKNSSVTGITYSWYVYGKIDKELIKK